MVKIIYSSDVYTDPKLNQDQEGQFHFISDGYHLGSLPTLYDTQGKFINVVNTWFFDLKAVKRLKNLSSSSRAMLCYWTFIEEQNLNWDVFPPINRLKPTYQFRNHLLSLIETGDLAFSTASCYMAHVVQFYSWAIHESYLVVKDEKSAPFQIEYATISRKDKLAHLRPRFTIQTSDLRIRVPRQAKSSQVGALSPLSREFLQLVVAFLCKEPIEFQLQCRLAIQSGLRINEVCTITLTALDRALPLTESGRRFHVPIGPSSGVKTKFSKERKIEIASPLLTALRNYSISERRLKRRIKMDDIQLANQNSLDNPASLNKREPLFISEQGNPATPQVLGVRWSEFRKKLQTIEPGFKHKFHDLRSTYGTYRLNDLLNSGLSDSEALDCLMGWMGHNHESTTWKYIRYLKRQEALRDKFAMLDSLMHDALTENEVHDEQ